MREIDNEINLIIIARSEIGFVSKFKTYNKYVTFASMSVLSN